MATAVFQGASSDWDDTDNWSGGAGAGGVPANGDTVIIAQSSQDLDTNLVTGLTSIVLKIGSGYTGTIGASDNHLDIDGTTFSFSSGGPVYFTGSWTTVRVDAGNASANMLQIKGNASSSMTNLWVLGGIGTVTVGDNASVTTLHMFNCPQVNVSIGAVSGMGNIIQDSGTLSASGNVSDTAELIGGVCTIDGTATVATLDLQDGGRCIYKSSGTITTLNAYGIFDGTQNMSSSVTITNTTTYETCRMLLRNGLNNWVFTNPITYRGGEIQFPPGSTLTVT